MSTLILLSNRPQALHAGLSQGRPARGRHRPHEPGRAPHPARVEGRPRRRELNATTSPPLEVAGGDVDGRSFTILRRLHRGDTAGERFLFV